MMTMKWGLEDPELEDPSKPCTEYQWSANLADQLTQLILLLVPYVLSRCEIPYCPQHQLMGDLREGADIRSHSHEVHCPPCISNVRLVMKEETPDQESRYSDKDLNNRVYKRSCPVFEVSMAAGPR